MARSYVGLRSLLVPVVVFLLLAAGGTCSRPISDAVARPRGLEYGPLMRLGNSAPTAGEAACEPTYGVLPCTTTAVGNLFLILVYGYLMFLSATYMSDGSELLLKVLGPGVVGGLFLPVLGAVPDALLILVSGLSGSRETAQQQVLIGMGLLAGSTIMLLTLLWGSCVVVGKCDLSEDSTSIDSQDTKKFSLFGLSALDSEEKAGLCKA